MNFFGKVVLMFAFIRLVKVYINGMHKLHIYQFVVTMILII